MQAAIEAGVATTTSTATAIFTGVLPELMVFFGGLIALGIALRLTKKLVGRKGA